MFNRKTTRQPQALFPTYFINNGLWTDPLLWPSFPHLRLSKCQGLCWDVLIFSPCAAALYMQWPLIPFLTFYKTSLLFVHKYSFTTIYSVNIWYHSSYIILYYACSLIIMFLLLSSRNICLILTSFTKSSLSSFSTPFLASGKLFLVEFWIQCSMQTKQMFWSLMYMNAYINTIYKKSNVVKG